MPEPSSELQIRKPEAMVTRTVQRPREARPEPHHAGLSRADILYALFKHRKIIILTTIIGIAAAGGAFFLDAPFYQSQAKLLVRYVVERSTVDSLDAAATASSRAGGDTVLGSEIEILTSWDLAVQTAEAIGPKRLLPKSKTPPTKEAAARTVASGLDVRTTKGSNIIFVSYKNHDPELATLVLSELVNRYFNKHLEVHRSAGAFDFVTQQTDQVRARLNQTEDALKELKEKAGIVSLADSTGALSTEVARTEEQLHSAEAELAEQAARVRQLGGAVVEVNPSPAKSAEGEEKTASPGASPAKEIPSDVLEQYQSLVSSLPQLRQAKMELLAKYTPENQLVKSKQAEINETERQRKSMEAKYPDLPSKVGPVGSSRLDPASEAAHLAGLQAKRNALAARLAEVKTRIQQMSQLGPQIADLERQKELEEANYKYFQATLEKARVDEALDPSKIPNISAVQRPSPPILMTTKRNKLMSALAALGLGAGVAFALVKELFLSRTVRRAVELERFVGVTPLMSIPFTEKGGGSRRKKNKKNGAGPPQPNGAGSGGKNLAPWDANHFIRPFCEAIRDRIGLYFELHHLTHKPKLVGVAGFADSAGTSTLAAGLAAALSETNDGKVLLVDVNLGPDQVHPFFRGRPAYSLNTALKPSGPMNPAAENLYLAKVGTPNAGPAQLGFKKFFDLMPNLKASDFDYIIFDMPPLTETSPTWGMAAFMDKVLLVVEAEKNNRDVLKRGYRKLAVERNNVSMVVNKVRSYGPKWAELEG